ncbi:leucyl aminopeptidase [Demequina sp. NBRC 110053]|uniref:leucyl aminopeptidase n=1 Tax=Demequina sp. NBRC 110053 TaxID=1570342 RepID=UPI0009FD765F|nr:leucyl aminopeptidase [Demequina sp. NBRC 110053]
MTSLNATSETVSTLDADALILGFDGDVASHPQLPDEVRTAVAQTAAALEPSAKVGATTILPGTGVTATRIVLVGLGDASEGDLRFAAGAAARSCGKKPSTVVVAIPADSDAKASAIAEGALLGAYTFTDYKSSEDDAEPHATAWHIAGASDAAIERAQIIAAAVASTRDLTNTSPLDLYPASFAEIAHEYAGQLGVEALTWEPQQLAEQGFGGILAVGMGSSRLPRLVRLSWKPEDATGSVALVGKGITFDTGGISLKPPKSMETMKSDMTGAAAVMNIVFAAARAKLPIAVTGWLCLAENMPSGTAQRPSDVIRHYGGKTVEVLNTDAEGRLVMADGLARAIEEEPDVVLDIATLTGAQGVALGTRTSAVMGDDAIRAEVVEAAGEVDEAFWPMPLPAHLREELESKIADLQNIAGPAGGMLSAGLFLKEFVGDTPWAHLDIARPAYNEGKPYGFTPAGGTGASVRTMFRFLEKRAGL